jgi:4'-phosphopantetheinyl transferase EntD
MQPIQLFWLECAESNLPDDEDWLSDAEVASFRKRWLPQRRRDWLLGRWTAKQAISAYLGAASDTTVLRTYSILAAASGAPFVALCGEPMDLSLSISHREGHALAVISPWKAVPVGCDLEKAEPRSAAFLQDFLTSSEMEQIEKASAIHQATLGSLIWSVKESVLKVMELGLRVDTRCVSVDVELAENSAKRWRRFTATVVDDRRFSGWWRRDSTWLKTIVASAPSLTPELLSLTVLPLRYPALSVAMSRGVRSEE